MTSHSKTLLTVTAFRIQSSSAVIQTGSDRPGSMGSRYVRLPQHVPVQKILSSLRMARAIRSKNTIVIFSKGSPELSVLLKTIANFLNSSSQSVKKTQDVTRAKKSSAVRASASRSKKKISDF